MEISVDTIISILTLFMGGGCGAFFTWRYQRRKAKAEAIDSEATATEKVQDVYQQLITDIKADREDRDDLRKRQDQLEEQVRTLQKEVARNGRMVECMRPLLCGRKGCSDRLPVTISDDGEIERKSKKKEE